MPILPVVRKAAHLEAAFCNGHRGDNGPRPSLPRHRSHRLMLRSTSEDRVRSNGGHMNTADPIAALSADGSALGFRSSDTATTISTADDEASRDRAPQFVNTDASATNNPARKPTDAPLKPSRRTSARSLPVRPSLLRSRPSLALINSVYNARSPDRTSPTRQTMRQRLRRYGCAFTPKLVMQHFRFHLRLLQLTYYAWTIPLRLGLFFDPHDSKQSRQWNYALTAFSFFDAFFDAFGFAYCYYQRREASQNGALPHQASDASLLQILLSPRFRSRPSWPYLYASSYTRSDERKNSTATQCSSVLVDVITLLPIEVIALGISYNLLHVVRLTKLVALIDFPSVYSHMRRRFLHIRVIQELQQHVLALLLFHLIAFGVVWMHWSAMIYMFLGHAKCGLNLGLCSSEGDSWAVRDQLRDSTNLRKYARTMYWASRTIITLGFSDTTATNELESFYTILCEFVGAFWCAMIISSWAYWFSTMRNVEQTHELFVYNVKMYLTSIEAPAALQDRIVMFLQYKWMTSRNFSEAQFLELVSQEHLQSCFRTELKTARMLQLPVFAEQSVGFVNALASTMSVETFAPLDWVIEYPSTQTEMFVVVYGCVAIVSDAHDGSKIYTCIHGDSFGAVTMFHAPSGEERAFAETFVQTIKLTKQHLNDTLLSYYRDPATANEVMQSMQLAAQNEYTDFLDRRARPRSSLSGPEITAPSAITTLPYWEQLKQTTERIKPWQHPHSTFRKRWEAARCIGLLYLAMEVPYIVIFYYGKNGDFGEWGFNVTFILSVIAELFFYVDFYYRCCHFWLPPRPDSLNEASTRSAILAAFKQNGDFHLDLLAHLPFAFIFDIVDGFTIIPPKLAFLSLLRLFRFLRVRYLNRVVRATLHRLTGSVQFIVYCVLAIFFYCHFVACFWYITGHFSLAKDSYAHLPANSLSRSECLRQAQQTSNCSWTIMDGMEVLNVDMKFAYLRSLYFSISTFTTVAYGDIIPYNIGESWVANFATYVGGILCYCVIGAMGSAIARLAIHGREVRFQEHVVNRFFRKHSLSTKLLLSVQRFYRFWNLVLEANSTECELLDSLSPGLCEALCVHLHLDAARNIATCVGTSEAFIHALAGRMERRICYDKEVIITMGDAPTHMFVIQSGHLREVDPVTGSTWRVFHDEMCVGEEEFFATRRKHRANVETIAVSELSVLSRERYQALLVHFPQDHQHILDVSKDRFRENSMRVSSANADRRRNRPGTAGDSRRRMSPRDSILAVTTRTEVIANPTNAADKIGSIAGRFRRGWEVTIAVIVLYNSFAITTRIIYVPEPPTLAMFILTAVDWITDVFLLVDIYFKLNFFAPSSDIAGKMTKPQIRAHYKRRWFYYDLVAALPMYYVGKNFKFMTWCRVPRLIRILQMLELSHVIQSFLARRHSTRRSHSLLGLLKVFALYTFSCHMGGSIYYAIANYEQDPRGWLQTDVVTLASSGNRLVAYVRAFYWAMSTFTVINYGDIVATTFKETIWASIICLTGTFFMSNVGGEVVEIFKSLDRIATEHHHFLESFHHFAHTRGLSVEIQERASQYLHFKFEMHEGMDAKSMSQSLAPRLFRSLSSEMYAALLKNLPLFEPLSDPQRAEVASMLRPMLFLPRDIIVYERSSGDALFVMKNGRAEAMRMDTGLALATINEGEMFGDIAFFNGRSRMASVRAITYCETLCVKKTDWDAFASRPLNAIAVGKVVDRAKIEYQQYARVCDNIVRNLGVESPFSTRLQNDDSESSRIVINVRDIDSIRVTSRKLIRMLERDTMTSELAALPSNAPPRRQSLPLVLPARDHVLDDAFMPSVLEQPSTHKVQPMLRRKYGSMPAIIPQSQPPMQPSIAESETSSPSVTVDKLSVNADAEPSHDAFIDSQSIRRLSGSKTASKPVLDVLDETEEKPAPVNLRISLEMAADKSMFVETSNFRYAWDGVKFLATCYYLVAIPLRVAFFTDISEQHSSSSFVDIWVAFEYVVDAFFVLDIYLRLFHFRPVVRGVVWTDHRQCRRHYMRKGGFYLDLLGSFPFEVFSLLPIEYFRDHEAFTASIFRLEILVRCFQVESLWRRVERFLVYEHNVRVNQDAIAYAKMLFISMVSSHWIACLWFIVGRESLRHGAVSWLNTPYMLTPNDDTTPIESVPLLTKYLRSYHYAIGSLSTVTYGDICSRNLAETIAQLFISFLCIVFYGFITGGCRDVLERHLARRIAFEQQLSRIKHFTAHYRLSHGFAFRVCKLLSEQWHHQGKVDQTQALAPLSEHLRCDILVDLRKVLLHRSPNAFDGFSTILVRAILSRLREEVFSAQDVVYEEFSTTSRSMYFVESGLLILRNHDKTIDKVCHPGDYCGEFAMLTGMPRQATCVAMSRSHVAVLCHSAYEEVIALFPDHKQQVEHMWLAHSRGGS